MRIGLFLKPAIICLCLFLVIGCIQRAVKYHTDNVEEDTVTLSARNVERQLQCMTKNVYWEAASEPFEGKVAVAQVTMNRMMSGKFPDSVCGVVEQKTSFYKNVVCQFSWFCETNHVTKPVYKKMYDESGEVAKMVMLEGFRLPNLKDAMYYHADYVNPRWNKEKITQIGRHIFYKEKTRV